LQNAFAKPLDSDEKIPIVTARQDLKSAVKNASALGKAQEGSPEKVKNASSDEKVKKVGSQVKARDASSDEKVKKVGSQVKARDASSDKKSEEVPLVQKSMSYIDISRNILHQSENLFVERLLASNKGVALIISTHVCKRFKRTQSQPRHR
ncbi:hypothetical protein COOONC_19812, partial [Cooperia oncophora]